MPSIHFLNVSFSHSSAIDLLTDISVDLGQGWSGLVGANGSGKSTLLSLTSGDLQPNTGTIAVDGSVILCPQSAYQLAPETLDFSQSWSAEDFDLRRRLELDPTDLERWATLSPGERKRWQIGAALAGQPDILLLDEPTNHVDRQGHGILAKALQRFPGVGVLVSHDRTLLDSITTKTLRIVRSSVKVWGAPYSEAKKLWESDEARQRSEFQTTKRELRKTQKRLSDQQRSAETERARTRRQFRMSGPKDHDAHSAAATGKAAGGDAAMSKAIAVTKAKAERLAIQTERFDISRTPGREFFFDYEPARRRRLLAFSGRLVVGDRRILNETDLVVERDDRIRLAGRNGAGKTTLIQHLLEGADLDPRRMLYLPQESTPREISDLTSRLMALPRDLRGSVLQMAAALGADPDRIVSSDSLSPGESRKLTIAFGLGTSVWCLVLDEPTNHLDLPSIERLQAALSVYPGSLLVVTHDDQLAAGVTNTTWTIENCELHVGQPVSD